MGQEHVSSTFRSLYVRLQIRLVLTQLTLLISLQLIPISIARAEIVCEVGHGQLKFGQVSQHSHETAIGEFAINCHNLSNKSDSTQVTVSLSSANDYKLGNQRNNSGAFSIRLYTDDTLSVALGSSGEEAVLMRRDLTVGAQSSEQFIVPLYATLDVGKRPSVGDYAGSLAVEVRLKPIGLDSSSE